MRAAAFSTRNKEHWVETQGHSNRRFHIDFHSMWKDNKSFLKENR
jgi:hypothetical protein